PPAIVMTTRYAVASRDKPLPIGSPHGGYTPVTCSTTSTRMLPTATATNPTATAPTLRRLMFSPSYPMSNLTAWDRHRGGPHDLRVGGRGLLALVASASRRVNA